MNEATYPDEDQDYFSYIMGKENRLVVTQAWFEEVLKPFLIENDCIIVEPRHFTLTDELKTVVTLMLPEGRYIVEAGDI